MKKTSKIKRLILDADDTLWENNIYYINTAEDFVDLITQSGLSKEKIEQDFQTLERKVVKEMGYGSQNYLYILRTVFEQYASVINIQDITPEFEEICSEFESHLHTPPKIFPEVPSILAKLGEKYQLYILTKGNIEEQKQKLEKSELLKYFQQAFVESEKDINTYRRILKDNQWAVDEICMIGNSPKSDINPALKLGMCAVLIPYQHTWVLEDEPLLPNQDRLKIVQSFSDLPSLFY
ncbi:MAG: HAD hydrolase-like protein [Calditrichia bacterium]|nr:HAD hydrolase-like protein [Calditrichia bacterium]